MVTKAARKLLQRMKQSPAGWKPEDFATVYNGYGFEAREGAGHTIYIHPDYPQLRATVARHGKLARGYADHAIEVLAELERLESRQRGIIAAAEEQGDDDD